MAAIVSNAMKSLLSCINKSVNFIARLFHLLRVVYQLDPHREDFLRPLSKKEPNQRNTLGLLAVRWPRSQAGTVQLIVN